MRCARRAVSGRAFLGGLLAALLAGLAAGDAAAQAPAAPADSVDTVVDGFRGHRWGTKRAAIPELDGARLGTAPNGMAAAGVDARFAGREGVAFYLFDPESDELLEGIYVFQLSIEACDGAWEAMEARLGADHPGLEIERVKTEWAGPEKSAYDSYCEFVVFNPSSASWITRWRNAGSGLVELGMAVRPQALEPRLSVLYVSPRAARWEAERAEAAREAAATGDSAASGVTADSSDAREREGAPGP